MPYTIYYQVQKAEGNPNNIQQEENQMKYGRTFNFSAGPAMMPEPVLEEIRDEMMNYRGSGMCVMEMSHRSKVLSLIHI